jgi:hypothetical protein
MLHQRFIYIHLLSSHLPANADFSAVAHDRGLLSSSRTAWFDACLCRPISRDLPSSTSVAPKRRSFSPSFTSHLGCPISNPSPCLALILNQGRFPPPALPGFISTTSPSVTPSSPACPSRAAGWASRSPARWAFPCCAVFLFHACHRHYPAEPLGTLFARFPSGGSLPRKLAGSASALIFSRPAQRSFTLRPACSPSPSQDPLYRRLQPLRYLRDCFDCYRLERTLPGGICTHGKTVPLHGALTY